jgi:hypothetical protein
VDGGFFQEIGHSGINPYLTLHVAQALLRSGDARHFNLVKVVAGLASSTGQWPEAVHPQTRGGCMGDGQHIWAAAEWIVMMRNLFVREEGDRLILCSGLPAEWLGAGRLSFGPTPTRFGLISVTVRPRPGAIDVEWTARWHHDAPPIEIRLPGYQRALAPAGADRVSLKTASR